MKVNQATVDLVKKWEGFKSEAYLCPANVWTIGYGTTSNAGIGVTVRPGMRASRDDAERWLQAGLERFADELRPHFTRPANPNQFGAFVSLAYNVGSGAVIRSTALRRWNEGNAEAVPAEFRRWVNAGGRRMQGLANRREDEIRLFLAPTAPERPEPTGLWAAIARLFRRA